MGKLLYIFFGDASVPGRGELKKMDSQIDVFQKAGLETTFLSGYKRGIAVYRGNSHEEPQVLRLCGGIRQQLAAWVRKHAEEFDCLYVRFQFFDWFLLRLLKSMKKHGAKVIMEIPTYPYTRELMAQGAKGYPKMVIDWLFHSACAHYIDYFVSPAYEGEICGKQTLPMKNGIDVDAIAARIPSESAENKIRMLAVASMSPRHGYQRIIAGMGDYYRNGGDADLELHMVGDGAELNMYKNMTAELGLNDRVKFYGRQEGEALDRLYNGAELGICSLGTLAFNVKNMNSLKTLEYLAKGIPIVCENNEISLPIDSEYRLNVASGTDPLNMEEIIAFYHRIYDGMPKQQVIDYIREYCKQECGMDVAMKHVVRFFLEGGGSNA